MQGWAASRQITLTTDQVVQGVLLLRGTLEEVRDPYSPIGDLADLGPAAPLDVGGQSRRSHGAADPPRRGRPLRCVVTDPVTEEREQALFARQSVNQGEQEARLFALTQRPASP